MTTHKSAACISNEDLIKLQNILNVVEATRLIVGEDAERIQVEEHSEAEGGLIFKYNSADYETCNAFPKVFNALVYAIKASAIKATVRPYASPRHVVYSESPEKWLIEAELNPFSTTISRDDLKAWLEERGVHPPQLFPDKLSKPYLSSEHPNFSNKLAACVLAWDSAQKADMSGTTVKKWIKSWLIENKESLGLNLTDSSDVFEQLASVSNWDTTGGKVSANLPPNIGGSKEAAKQSSNTDTIHQDLIDDDWNIDNLPF